MKVHALASALTILLSPAAAADEAQIIDLVAADALKETRLSMDLAPLKSAADVYHYHQSMPENLSPLSALSKQEQTRFIQSLRFNERGLTQFDYRILTQLDAEQVYRILALFGLQSGTSLIKDDEARNTDAVKKIRGFLPGYYCEDRGTCREDDSRACTENC